MVEKFGKAQVRRSLAKEQAKFRTRLRRVAHLEAEGVQTPHAMSTFNKGHTAVPKENLETKSVKN